MMFIDVKTYEVSHSYCDSFGSSELVAVPNGTELIILNKRCVLYFLKSSDDRWYCKEIGVHLDVWLPLPSKFSPYDDGFRVVWNIREVISDAMSEVIAGSDVEIVNNVDVVNHPKHYTSDDCGVEAIEITSLLPCCISNALKYVWRCGKKDDDLQELKKAEWYLEYSISNNLPSTISGLSDTLDFEGLINKVKESWVGDKYMFIDALYWGNQELMLKAVKSIIESVVESIENSDGSGNSVNTVSGLSKIGESK